MFTMRLVREYTVQRDLWRQAPEMCHTHPMPESFHLEIHGLPAFAAFVAIIRGQEPDEAQLKALTQTITNTNADLADAEKPYLPPTP